MFVADMVGRIEAMGLSARVKPEANRGFVRIEPFYEDAIP